MRATDHGSVHCAGYSWLNPLHLSFLFLAVAIAGAINAVNPDLWMHLCAGRVILTTFRIPRSDIYSYSAAGLPWRDHEWLSQAVFALAYDCCGVIGLRIVKLACVTITMAGLASALGRCGASPRAQRLILIVTAVALAPYMHYRPQLFTFGLLSVEMALLWANYRSGTEMMWLLVPLFAIWANLHGGFIAGLGALGIYTLIVCIEDRLTGSDSGQDSELIALTVASALATLLNPFGTGAWTNVFHSVLNPTVHRAILEWAPAWIALQYNWVSHASELLDLLPFALPLMLVIVAARTRAIGHYPTTAIAAVFSLAALFSMRNMPLAAITVAPVLGFQLAIEARRREGETLEGDTPGLSPTVIGTLAVVVLILGALPSPNALRGGSAYPSGAVSFMKLHGLHGNILNEYRWGAYLVWNTAPDSKIFIDSRSELVYPDRVLEQYLEFAGGTAAGTRLLDQYPHDFVLIERNSDAVKVVSQAPGWKLIYSDDVSALFARSDAASFVRRSTGLQLRPGNGPSVFKPK